MHKHGHFCFWGLVEVKPKKSTVGGRFSIVSVISVFIKHIQWDVWIEAFKCYSIPFPLNTV